MDELTVGTSPAITARGWSHLRRRRDLKEFSAFEVQVTLEAASTLSGLPKLESLSFSHSRFAPHAIAQLARSQSLEKLVFWENNHFENDNRFVVGDLPRLRQLNFVGANASPELLASISELKSLERLGVVGPEFTDVELGHISQLPLTDLSLEGTSITDDGLATLSRMKRLRQLSLVGTQFSDSGMVHLEPLTNLTRFHLSDTNIGDAGLESIGRLSKLEWIFFKGTNVTPAGAKALKARLPEADVFLDDLIY